MYSDWYSRVNMRHDTVGFYVQDVLKTLWIERYVFFAKILWKKNLKLCYHGENRFCKYVWISVGFHNISMFFFHCQISLIFGHFCVKFENALIFLFFKVGSSAFQVFFVSSRNVHFRWKSMFSYLGRLYTPTTKTSIFTKIFFFVIFSKKSMF